MVQGSLPWSVKRRCQGMGLERRSSININHVLRIAPMTAAGNQQPRHGPKGTESGQDGNLLDPKGVLVPHAK